MRNPKAWPQFRGVSRHSCAKSHKLAQRKRYRPRKQLQQLDFTHLTT